MKPTRLMLSILGAMTLSLVSATGQSAQSHIEANIPAESEFEAFLARDVARYLLESGSSEATKIVLTLLRDGPTQSGTPYPKFYVWISASLKGGQKVAGAARVVAIERRRFEVTHFMHDNEVRATPAELEWIFPAALVDKIKALAGAVN